MAHKKKQKTTLQLIKDLPVFRGCLLIERREWGNLCLQLVKDLSDRPHQGAFGHLLDFMVPKSIRRKNQRLLIIIRNYFIIFCNLSLCKSNLRCQLFIMFNFCHRFIATRDRYSKLHTNKQINMKYCNTHSSSSKTSEDECELLFLCKL